MQTVTLSLFRFAPGTDRVWALAMMGVARSAMRRLPGLDFWKLLGSGTGEGFTPRPNWAVYAILGVWQDARCARRETQDAQIFRRYRARAQEAWTVFLSPVSVRGAWSGQTPFKAQKTVTTGPLAALTRATIRPAAAVRFWNRVPNISAAIGADQNVIFKIGVGEVPLLHQVTFSIWPDATSISRFARAGGPHARAINAVRHGNWFREELYARFAITGSHGTWERCDPLANILSPDGTIPAGSYHAPQDRLEIA